MNDDIFSFKKCSVVPRAGASKQSQASVRFTAVSYTGPYSLGQMLLSLRFLSCKMEILILISMCYMRINEIILVKGKHTEEIQVMLVESTYDLTQSQGKL